jgi:3-phosphoshikimate 1-carboxyvinyltransferase
MKTISPFRFHHHIHANASKSDAQRCLILAAFNDSPTDIFGMDGSADILSMQRCLEEMGAEFIGTNPIQVKPVGKQVKKTLALNVEESGFALRTLAFLSLVCSNDVRINGSGTLLNREQGQLITILEQLGLTVDSNQGKIPLHIKGNPFIADLTIDGSAGSQAISGLCLLAPHLPNRLSIRVNDLKSKPYLAMTIQRMHAMGISIEELGENAFSIAGNQSYHPTTCHIEGDWSGAANHIVGAAISGIVNLSGLRIDSLQADRQILEVIKEFGATVEQSESELIVRESLVKRPIHTNIEDCPDLFPILVVLACAADGTSIIQGIQRLQNKESDRLLVMCELLTTFGVSYEIQSNEIHIHGTGKVLGGMVNTHRDHRIAMAASIAATISTQDIILSDESCISKSYPKFFQDLPC